MLDDYLREIQAYLSREFDTAEYADKFQIDNSEFIVVDGEEGDYGVTKYLHNSELVAIRTDEGGDSYYLEYTDYGKELLRNMIIEKLREFKF